MQLLEQRQESKKLLLDVTITAGCCVKVNKASASRQSGSRNWVSQQNLQEGKLQGEIGIKASKTVTLGFQMDHI